MSVTRLRIVVGEFYEVNIEDPNRVSLLAMRLWL